MLDMKLYKNNAEDMAKYTDLAQWCNQNNATIEDKGGYYECVAIPTSSLDELKAQKLQAVDAWTAAKITGGFTSDASGELVRYDSDKDTQLTMQGIALNVNTNRFATEYPNGCPVRGYEIFDGVAIAGEKSVFMLTAEQVLAWCADLSVHIGNCKQEGWAKQNLVNKATTKEELDLIEL